MNGPLHGDEAWKEDLEFIADLAQLNDRLKRYVLRYMDADAGRTSPVGTADERALGSWMVELGKALQSRADRRAHVVEAEPNTETDNGP